MSLIGAATAIVELLDQYDCDPDLTAAKSQLSAAVVAELMQTGTYVTVPRGGRPGHDRATRDEVMRLVGGGLAYPEIAAKTGVGEATVKRWARDAGVKRTRGPKPKSPNLADPRVPRLK